MKSISALFNVFLAAFVISIPGTGIINDFTNALAAAYLGAAAVAFVYDNLPTNEYETLSFVKAKIFIAMTAILGSPIVLYAYLWSVLAPHGFNQVLVLLVLAAVFYIPMAIIAWIAFWFMIAVLGID